MIIECPRYYLVETIDTTSTNDDAYIYFKVNCLTCGVDEYILTEGKIFINAMGFEPSQKGHKDKKYTNFTMRNPVCLPCPAGAICDGDIKAMDNSWGYKSTSKELIFLPCPAGYCCSRDGNKCTSYNTCNVGRESVLCGKCSKGYVQSFLTDDCVLPKKKCNLPLFVIGLVGYSCFYTLLLIYLLDIIRYVKRPCCWSNQNDPNFSYTRNTGNELMRQTSKNISSKDPSMFSVVLMIAFYFQIASLVHVPFRINDHLNSLGKVRAFISNLFNFRNTFYEIFCPFEEFNLLHKWFINVGLKCICLLNLLIAFMVWKLHGLVVGIRGNFRPRDDEILIINNEETSENDIQHRSEHEVLGQLCHAESGMDDSLLLEVEEELTFPMKLKVAFLRFLKLLLTPFATFSFQMIKCIAINDHFHLYIYGDQECYSWWQILISVVLIPNILLFPTSFEMSLCLLRTHQISTNTFLFVSIIPVYGLFLYAKIHITGPIQRCQTKEESLCAATILQIEEDMVKPSEGVFCWRVLQLYRNMLIVVIRTFIINPIYRSGTFLLVFILFVVNDALQKPYKSDYQNALQTLTSTCLAVSAFCNAMFSVCSMSNLMDTPHMEVFIKILKSLDVSLYFCVSLSFPLWKIWRKLQNSKKLAKDIHID